MVRAGAGINEWGERWLNNAARYYLLHTSQTLIDLLAIFLVTIGPLSPVLAVCVGCCAECFLLPLLLLQRKVQHSRREGVAGERDKQHMQMLSIMAGGFPGSPFTEVGLKGWKRHSL